MSRRFVVASLVGVLAPAAALTVAWAQSGDSADASGYTAPRTPWGEPDLQGVWDYRTITPMERPRQFGDREFYTEEEIAELEGRAEAKMDLPPGEDAPVNLVHAQYMTDPGTTIDESHRTSLIIDPPNGRMPELTAQAQARQAAGRGRGGELNAAQPWLDRSNLERCITYGLPNAILPGLYNNNIEIVQSPGYVAIVHEMVHDTRIVPLDGSEFTGIRGWLGESRGHWEGDTLVVETRNFTDDISWRGAGPNMKLTERYTRISDDRIDFRLTIEDDTNWTSPFTVAFLMRPTEGQIYEYACHEGNYGLRNILENLVTEQQAATGN